MRHHFEGDKSVFDLSQGRQLDRIVYLQCGRVGEFHDATIESRQKKAAPAAGFSVDHLFYIYTDCTKHKCKISAHGILRPRKEQFAIQSNIPW
ncbi:MAG: transcriptional repressor [Gallionellaceae bacterium]